MAKSNSKSSRDSKGVRWIVIVFFITIFISAAMSLISEEIMDGTSMWFAFFVLLFIVMLGIFFDIIGVAVTSASATPFHSMAAKKVPGSVESIRLLKNAERVSSICNDVVGDICGVISGSASAAIAMRVVNNFSFSTENVATLVMSALVAGLTVGGKAIGKTVAMRSCTGIVHLVGVAIYRFEHFFHIGGGKKKSK